MIFGLTIMLRSINLIVFWNCWSVFLCIYSGWWYIPCICFFISNEMDLGFKPKQCVQGLANLLHLRLKSNRHRNTCEYKKKKKEKRKKGANSKKYTNCQIHIKILMPAFLSFSSNHIFHNSFLTTPKYLNPKN